MVEENISLIHRILDGEEEAFGILVKKYQKRIHTLAWKKIGDYHIAEEITQDVLLQVYNKLYTLKNLNQFDGWLYVIVDRFCKNWKKRNKSKFQSLNSMPIYQIEEAFYKEYQTEQRSSERIEYYREIVKQLLERLPESERTVVTLYYYADMTALDISKYLGVSVNTIKSRLRRAKVRLRAEEQLFIQESIRSVQLSTDLSESILQQIANMKPSPSVSKPLLPWAALGTAAALLMFMFGAANQYISNFQKPFNYDARSQQTIEIVESPISLNEVSKSASIQNVGVASIEANNIGTGLHRSEAVVTDLTQDIFSYHKPSNWIKANPPKSTSIYNLFATSQNDLYAVTSTGIYELTDDAVYWSRINENLPNNRFRDIITEHQGVLYSINRDEIYTSTDDGVTWQFLCSRPNGRPIDLIIGDMSQRKLSYKDSVMFLVLKNAGVFQSFDRGKEWLPINNGLVETEVSAFVNIGNAMFLGTKGGLYHWDTDIWERLAMDEITDVQSLAATETDLYVVTSQDNINGDWPGRDQNEHTYIFHSIDLGRTWREITPKDRSFLKRKSSNIPTKIIANGKTLFVLGEPTFHSMDKGQTWEKLESDISSTLKTNSSICLIDEKLLYRTDTFRVYRSIDGGISWNSFIKGIEGTNALDLLVFKDKLYINTGGDIFRSFDNGVSWQQVKIAVNQSIQYLNHQTQHNRHPLVDSKFAIVDNTLYLITPYRDKIKVFGLHKDGNRFDMVQSIATQNSEKGHISLSESSENNVISVCSPVNNRFLYIKQNKRLFKWDPINLKITETELIHLPRRQKLIMNTEANLSASTNYLYVSTRTGRLLQSDDGGIMWHDVTPYIYGEYLEIHDIVFVGSTVYVATDKGVFHSRTGEYWDVLTDSHGNKTHIQKLTTDNYRLFGVGYGAVYQLDYCNEWKLIVTNVPDLVNTIEINRDRLYIATIHSGVYHISLQDDPLGIRALSIR